MKNLIDYLKNTFARNITAEIVLPPEDGDFAPLPNTLNQKLLKVLTDQKLMRLYSHQAEAFESISHDIDTGLVSRTASGKTLSFLLPILNEYANATTPFSTLLLYPTKALSRDQEGTLGKLLQAVDAERKFGTFDGDTPPDQRKILQKNADFVITNPDMLHAGFLPNHQRLWKSFLSRLRYIVIDEVHSYRGSFGSHVANVFRRLLRVCALYGVKPTFIACSATVGNPAEHMKALFGRDFHIIQKDGAPRPERKLFCVNPPLFTAEDGANYRKGPASVSIPLIRKATELGIRTICFCRGRQEVERLYRSVTDGKYANLADRVKPYRGGLLPSERRKLEHDLFNGVINTIITTNALELGIDIGNLDLCILSGHPGTMASFWQQAGRVGRKGDGAVIVYVAKDTPIDQYLVNHTNFITQAPVEQAWLNADNPYIVLQHIPCSAQEYPVRMDEPTWSSPAAQMAIKLLIEQETLKPWSGGYRYGLTDYPSRGVNLRGMTDYNIQIVCDDVVIGEIDPIGARGTLYKDAIYQHLGERYMSMDLDLDKKLCIVEKVHVDYFTEASWENRVELTEVYEECEFPNAELKFGAIHVNKQPKLYKKIRERTYENIGYGPITLPPFEYDTTGLTLRPPKDWIALMDSHDKRWLGAALYGLGYILRRVAPSLCMADEQDVDTDISLATDDAQRWTSALFLFDTHEGGVGYAEKICERLSDALQLCRDIIRDCHCKGGCPSCVPPFPPGIVSTPDLEELLLFSDAAVRCTESCITALLEGRYEIPTVTVRKLPPETPVTPPGEDPEELKMKERLLRASNLLEFKRKRLH